MNLKKKFIENFNRNSQVLYSLVNSPKKWKYKPKKNDKTTISLNKEIHQTIKVCVAQSFESYDHLLAVLLDIWEKLQIPDVFKGKTLKLSEITI